MTLGNYSSFITGKKKIQARGSQVQQLEKYVKWVLSFGFDGIRADTVKYAGLLETLTRAIGPIYITGEVWDSFDYQFQYTHRGVPAALNYQL